MNAFLRHPLRVIGRLLWLITEFIFAAFRFVCSCLLRSRASSVAARAAWLQAICRRFLRIFGTQLRVSGPVPSRGLLVSNHLSYFDIVVLGSLTPSVFVAKREVKSWPVFGWFATMAGTLYVDRQRRTHVGEVADEIQKVLDQGVLVILFPEGTSSGGQTVLPFKSSLLEPATRQTGSLTVGRIRYELDDGDVSEEVCYWKNMTLVPHLLNLLSKRRIRAFVRFARPPESHADRKELARQLHAEVVKLGES